MNSGSRLRVSAGCWLTWLLSALATALPAWADRTPPVSETDARIKFYRERIGGPATYPAHARLGLAYLQKARETGRASFYDEALQHLLKSLSYQRNFEAALGAAIVLSERHEFSKALPYAEEAAAAMPSDLDAHGARFDIQLALGQVEQAAAIADAMIKLQPSFPAFIRLAALRSYRGDPRGAVEAMTKARDDAEAKRLPANTRAWAEVRLGSLQIACGEADPATQACYRALRIFPNYYLALEHLAELDAAQGKPDAAMATYRELLRKVPDPRYRVALAELHEQQGKARLARQERDQAIAEWRRAVGSGSKADLRAFALLLLERPPDAAEGLRLAQLDWENRKDAFAADTLAWAYFKNGKIREAQPISAEAMKSGTKEPVVLLHAALIHRGLGNQPQARALLTQVLACSLPLSPADRALAEKTFAEMEKAIPSR